MSERVIFWDFDGTLAFRVSGKWAAAMHEALQEMQPATKLTTADFRPLLTTGFPWHTPGNSHTHLLDPDDYWAEMEQLFVGVYRRLGLAEDALPLAARVRWHYTRAEAWALYDDTLPTLRRLAALGWTHVLLSNHVPELPQIAQALGLLPYLDVIVNSATVGYEKPHPSIFRLARELAGHPRTVWMVGDNPVADVKGAEAAGIPAILVRQPSENASRQSPDLAGAAGIILAEGKHREMEGTR